MRTFTRTLAILMALLAGTVFSVSGLQITEERAPMEDLIISADELTADIEKGTTIIGGELAPESMLGASFTGLRPCQS